MWLEDAGIDPKTGGRAEGGRVKDGEILFRTNRMDRIRNKHMKGMTKLGKPDYEGLDMYSRATVKILVDGGSRWS